MKRPRASAVVAAVAFAAGPAAAAPMGPGVEAARVLGLESDASLDLEAKSLTLALRQAVLNSPELTLNAEAAPLLPVANEARCQQFARLRRPFGAESDRALDAPCQQRIGALLGVKRYFWGIVYAEGSRPFVRLHFWQDGVDRAATLPYDEPSRDRVAERLYRKLVNPEKAGDVALVGEVEGELVVDGKPQGAYAPGLELTLLAGEHALEVRQGPRVVARARALVAAEGRAEARLEPAAPSPVGPAGPVNGPPSVTVRPRASAWPWVLGGATAAGLAGAGIFWGLRSGERADLERACDGRRCPPDQEGAADRADLYRTLAGASLGVGVVAGIGLGAYLFAARRRPASVSGAVVPLAGGAAATFAGSF